ncbi:uncharacterized protein LOC142554454 [Primulina tabacum]|uniref:uncharacterized protein LOC142554454 n=1 Tax=Primulina tabacum TaxID=48773 RepID=UPI003F5A1570
MDNTSGIRLLLLILCFSCIFGSNIVAIPVTRSGNLVQKSRSYRSVADEVYMENKSEKWEFTKRRRLMEIEVNDYPGSGANNRHTPRTQLGRGCLDC